MSLALLFPLGLAALAAWALPLLLHLVRREQQVPTDFAALRWLAIRAKPRTRVRFDERLLLLARIALIAALAVLLARPARTGGDADAAWVVVHPSLAGAVIPAPDTVERRWLAPGFPSLDTPPPPASVPTASLLRQLDAELPAGATLSVNVPSRLDGLDAGRIRLSRPVDWRIAEAPAVASAPSSPSAAHVLAIRHDPAHADAVRWLRAVAVAWRRTDDAATDTVATSDAPPAPPVDTPAIDIAPLDAALPAEATVLAWLGAGALPDAVRTWIDSGGTALLAHDAAWPLREPGTPITDDDGEPLAETARLGHGRVVRVSRPLQPAAWPELLEPTFPATLRTLVAAPAPVPTRADASTVAPQAGGPGFEPAPRELTTALFALVLALFALERWLATGRRAGSPA